MPPRPPLHPIVRLRGPQRTGRASGSWASRSPLALCTSAPSLRAKKNSSPWSTQPSAADGRPPQRRQRPSAGDPPSASTPVWSSSSFPAFSRWWTKGVKGGRVDCRGVSRPQQASALAARAQCLKRARIAADRPSIVVVGYKQLQNKAGGPGRHLRHGLHRFNHFGFTLNHFGCTYRRPHTAGDTHTDSTACPPTHHVLSGVTSCVASHTPAARATRCHTRARASWRRCRVVRPSVTLTRTQSHIEWLRMLQRRPR